MACESSTVYERSLSLSRLCCLCCSRRVPTTVPTETYASGTKRCNTKMPLSFRCAFTSSCCVHADRTNLRRPATAQTLRTTLFIIWLVVRLLRNATGEFLVWCGCVGERTGANVATTTTTLHCGQDVYWQSFARSPSKNLSVVYVCVRNPLPFGRPSFLPSDVMVMCVFW